MAFLRKLYHALDEMQTDVDTWVSYYNTQRPHSRRYCSGATPQQTFLHAKHIALDKQALGMFQPMLPDQVQLIDGRAADYTWPEHWAMLAIIGQSTSVGQTKPCHVPCVSSSCDLYREIGPQSMLVSLSNASIVNRDIIVFIYGQVFFVMGLAIALQSRSYSRLELARSLQWLAAFGIIHGLHEWGDLFIPLQATYLD